MASKSTKEKMELDMDNRSTTVYPPAAIPPSSSSQSRPPPASSSSSIVGPPNDDAFGLATTGPNPNEISSQFHQQSFLTHRQVATGGGMKPPPPPPPPPTRQIDHAGRHPPRRHPPPPEENKVVLATAPAAPTTSWSIFQNWMVQSYPPPTFSLQLKKRRPSWTQEEPQQEEQPLTANLETTSTFISMSMVEFDTTCRNILRNVDKLDLSTTTATTMAAAAVPSRFSRNQSTGSWLSYNGWNVTADSNNGQERQHTTAEATLTATRPLENGNSGAKKTALVVPFVRGAAERGVAEGPIFKEDQTNQVVRAVLETPNAAVSAPDHGSGVFVVPLDLAQICAHPEPWFHQQNHDEVDAFLLEPVDVAPTTQVGGPFDVFCLDGLGGGTRYCNEPGNKAFSKLMSAFTPMYLRRSTGSKNKAKISPCVVYTIRQLGGRFLKLKERQGAQESRGSSADPRADATETWVDIGNGRARLKVTRALQRAAKVKRESGQNKISKDCTAKEAETCETTQSSRSNEQTTDNKKVPKTADDKNTTRIILKIPKASVTFSAPQHAPTSVLTAMAFPSSSLSVSDLYSPIPCSKIRPRRRIRLPIRAAATVAPPTATIEDYQSHNDGIGKTRGDATLVASAGALVGSSSGTNGSNRKWSVHSHGRVGSLHQLDQNSNHMNKTARLKGVLNLLSSDASNGGLPTKADAMTKKRAIDTGNVALVPFATAKKRKEQEHGTLVDNQCLAIATDGSQCNHVTAVESPYHLSQTFGSISLVSGQTQPSVPFTKAVDTPMNEKERQAVDLIASWLAKDVEDDTDTVDASDALFAAQCLVRSGFRSVTEILTQIKAEDVAPWPHFSPTVKRRLRSKVEAFSVLTASTKSRQKI